MESYKIRNSDNLEVGLIQIYPKNLKIKKIITLKEPKNDRVIIMLKGEQFDKLDNLILETISKLQQFIQNCEDASLKIRYENKLNGLKNLQKKINFTKTEYKNKPKDQLIYNRLLNLYNSLKSFLEN